MGIRKPKKEKISKEMQGEQTRDAIMQAARILFFTQDYNSISTAEIAKEASRIAKDNGNYRTSISKASIFNHFESKEKLAKKIFESIGEELMSEFANLDTGSNDFEFLENMVRYSLNFMIEHPNVIQFLLQITNEMMKSGDNEVLESVDAMFGEYIVTFSQKFEHMGIKNSVIRARVLFGALDGLSLHLYLAIRAGEEVNIEPFVMEFMSLIQCWINQGEKL